MVALRLSKTLDGSGGGFYNTITTCLRGVVNFSKVGKISIKVTTIVVELK